MSAALPAMSSSADERAAAGPRRTGALPVGVLIAAPLLAVPPAGGTAYFGMFVNVPPPCAPGEAAGACERAMREGYHHPASTAFYALAAPEAAVAVAGWAPPRRARWVPRAAPIALPLLTAGGFWTVNRLFGAG
ncbi:hypothetical protein ACFQXA_04800 [Nocardiopsis composta]